jgi:peptidoglycan/xylan/chitin deacetylase (PgdA/CDA1 family)
MADKIPVGLTALSLGKGALSVTFDDFPKSAWEAGGEILARHRVRGSYYLSGGLAGSCYQNLPHFDAEDVRAVSAAGHEIGCHTFGHLSTLKTAPERVEKSLLENRLFLEGILPSYAMCTFAYPFGDVSLNAKRHLNHAFAASRGVRPGLNGNRVELTNLRAFALEDRQRARFDWREWVTRAANTKSWMIVFTHDVSPSPSPYGCKPSDLGLIIRLAQDAGLDVAPVAEILNQATVSNGQSKLP